MIAEKFLTVTPWPKYTYITGQGYRILQPVSKMSDCTECGADELTFIHEKTIMCMGCHTWFVKKD